VSKNIKGGLPIIREKVSVMGRTILDDVPFDETFRTCNGVILHNLSEMLSWLGAASEYDFRYHVNDDHSKNDFAIWVREAVQDEELARELDGELNKDRYTNRVYKHVKKLG